MDIVGIGSDIVECVRIGRMIEQHGEQFLQRVYTEREVRFCQGRKRAVEHFAGRWAAKEAVLKCLGAAGRKSLCWTDVEIRPTAQGKVQVLLCGAAKDAAQRLRVGDILVSIAHCRAYATAHAIALGRAATPNGTP
jgi:holo-[acyl-carrier protein] synthase